MKRMLVIIAAIIVIFVLLVIALVLIYSPGRLTPYREVNGKVLAGSIAEKLFIPVGGVKQGMFIKSRNINHPVLLYVHGGPAFPNSSHICR